MCKCCIYADIIFLMCLFRVCLVTKERRLVQNHFSQSTFVTTKLLSPTFKVSLCFKRDLVVILEQQDQKAIRLVDRCNLLLEQILKLSLVQLFPAHLCLTLIMSTSPHAVS